MDPTDAFADLMARDDEEPELDRAAFLFAAVEYPELDVEAGIRELDHLADLLQPRLAGLDRPEDVVRVVAGFLHGELGFAGNPDAYYDPRNSYLNEVIDRKLGIPITLAVLYIEIGRRIGLPLHGVSFPTHFLVKCALRDGAIILDPYARGASLGVDDLQERLKTIAKDIELDSTLVATLLANAAPNDIFARMLRNLCAIHANKGEHLKALSASNRILALQPDSPEAYRDRGELYAQLECFRAAVADLRHYLKLRPQAHDTDRVAGRIAELEPLAARLN